MIVNFFWSKKTRNFASICLGLILFSAGMAKLYAAHAFPGLIGPVWLEEKLSEFDLGLFARFIAFSQVLIGFLLISLRYSTLGAVMSIPMFLNILMVTVSQAWKGTPYVIIFFLLSNLYILIIDYKKLLPLINIKVENPVQYPFHLKSQLIWFAGLTLVLSSILTSYLSLMLAYTMVLLGLSLSFWSFRFDSKVPSTSPNLAGLPST